MPAEEAPMGKKAEGQVNPEEVGKTEEAPGGAEEEVGGRYRFHNIVVCPYCYGRNHIIESSTRYRYYSCFRCGGTFFK